MTSPAPRNTTAKDRLLDELRANPAGLSKSELRRRVGGNAGVFRRLVQSLVDTGDITVEEETDPTCGTTRVHRLGSMSMEGQQDLVERGGPGCTCGTPPFAPPEPSPDCPFHGSGR